MPVIPLPENERERLVALESYHIFDTVEEEDYDALASLASIICQVPIALITFIDEDRQWFKSHKGTDLTENTRALSFCTHTIASRGDVMIVPNASLDKRFANNPMVTGPYQINFYAGVPLVNEDGFALGTLCVIDQQAKELSSEQVEGLKTLAAQVVDKLELRRKVAHLERANRELLNSNVLIQKFASMAAHDIKNPLSSMRLTSQALKLRHKKLQDEGSLRLLELNITATDNLLTLVDEMLAYSKTPSLLLSRKQHFHLNTLIHKVLALLFVPENIIVSLPEKDSSLFLSIIAVEQIMINLLSNAIRYNDKEVGTVIIRFHEDSHYYRLEVEDNGIGIDEQYHQKIFDNNFTLQINDRYHTKGSGIGLATVRDLVKALNGEIRVRSVIGEGTTFFIAIQKANNATS